MISILSWLLLLSGLILRADQPLELLPDFGPDGLGGLSWEEKELLLTEEIVVPREPTILSDGKTVIAAAVIINQPVETVWRILSQPERQADYLKEIKKSRLVKEEGEEKWVYFEVDIYGFSIHYTVRHYLYPQLKSLAWELDPEAENDLSYLLGFWRLYPWSEGKTLARYGSQVVPKFRLARAIIQYLYRSRVKSSLLAVKKYLESIPADNLLVNSPGNCRQK
jgi:uncharacterized protein YndB with AHSA1/START domain